MLRWKRCSGVSPDRRFVLTFGGPETDPLATATDDALLDEREFVAVPTTKHITR